METSVRLLAAFCTLVSLSSRTLLAAEPSTASPIISGLKPGEHISTVFEPLNVNGPNAGEPHCLVCENGLSPVAMIWARNVDEPLVQLIAKLDAAAVMHAGQELGSFAVFIGEEADLEPRLRKVVNELRLRKLVLSINLDDAPKDYRVNDDADVTVMLYNRHEIRATHAFRKGELNDAAIEKILADLPKIVGDGK